MFKQVRKTHAYIERDGSVTRLMSYNTLICEVNTDSKNVLLSPYARCSPTTIRHLSEFLGKFGLSYNEAKTCLIDPSFKTVMHPNGFNMLVSEHPRFKLNKNAPFHI